MSSTKNKIKLVMTQFAENTEIPKSSSGSSYMMFKELQHYIVSLFIVIIRDTNLQITITQLFFIFISYMVKQWNLCPPALKQYTTQLVYELMTPFFQTNTNAHMCLNQVRRINQAQFSSFLFCTKCSEPINRSSHVNDVF